MLGLMGATPDRADGARRTQSDGPAQRLGPRIALAFAGLGIAGLAVSSVSDPSAARAAAVQDWPPFVLVAGLLLVGLVAANDGLFESAGRFLARATHGSVALFLGASLLVGIVTALLNLDTSVAFLTPVLIYAARSVGDDEAPLLYGCLMCSNAGSLFLPGSNLTNLIVLGHDKMSGARFFEHMWAPATAALLVTAAVVAVVTRPKSGGSTRERATSRPATIGVGLGAVVLATIAIIVLSAPALPVAGIGVATTAVAVVRRRTTWSNIAEVLGTPVLVGLYGVAVALGTVGRAWSGPATFLSHVNVWATAPVAALVTVVVNNLPAASLLASRVPSHPFALLIGLNLGPNLAVSGSLAWILWLRVARTSGAKPSLMRASRIGLFAVPTSLAAAVGLLVLTGNH